MSLLDDVRGTVKRDEPLAPYTYFRLGGAAERLVVPADVEDLQKVVVRCRQTDTPLRILGGGCNLLVRDEGVRGVVVKLEGAAFDRVAVQKTTVRAGAGAPLTALITRTAREGLAGLEMLAGIPGTVGGALAMNAGGRAGDIGQFVRSVTVMDAQGETDVRQRDELRFRYRETNIDEPVILGGELDLELEDPEAVIRRLLKLWITKKAKQPLGFQSAGCIFKNPPGMSAGMLIDRAELKGARVGGAEVSDRHANYIVAQPGATAADVLRLIDLIRERVAERFHVELELEIKIW